MLSSKPYLIRALWSWCCDAGLTPYLRLRVDEQCSVPMEYVQDGSLTLNVGPGATGRLDIGNDWVTLSARFGGVPRELIFPVGAVTAIYARENGAGMEFAYEPTALPEASEAQTSTSPPTSEPPPDPNRPKPGRPHLHRVK